MSRVGRKPIPVPAPVKVDLADHTISVQGPKGSLSFQYRESIGVAFDDAARQINVTRADDERENRALHGLTRSLIANMVEGVTTGYTRKLEIVGVGYQAQLRGKDTIVLQVGFANQVALKAPEGVTIALTDPTHIVLNGADKQAIGQFAAEIRAVRPPEPYKGKGVRYEGEVVRRKAGKAFGSK
jgi:large subunit ribosomal protein L6